MLVLAKLIKVNGKEGSDLARLPLQTNFLNPLRNLHPARGKIVIDFVFAEDGWCGIWSRLGAVLFDIRELAFCAVCQSMAAIRLACAAPAVRG